MYRRRKIALLCLGLLVLSAWGHVVPSVFADPVVLPQTLTGGGTGGSTFTVTGSGGTDNGTPTGTSNFSPGMTIEDGALGTRSDAFDNGLTVWVNDAIIAPPLSEVVDRTDQTITVGPQDMSGLSVRLQYHAVASSATLRTVVFLQNPTGSPMNANVKLFSNLGADSGATISGSSSGDTTFSNADRWVVTSDSTPFSTRPIITHVLGGPGTGAAKPTAVSQTVYKFATSPSGPAVDNGEGIGASFDVTVPANSTRVLMFFTQLNESDAEALTAAAAFDTNPAAASDFLAGLTAGDLAGMVNFNFNATKKVARLDFDGDGISDIGIYRNSTGEWLIRQSTDGNLLQVAWGAPVLHDVPVPADYDGSGRTEIAVYRQDTGEWFIRESNGNLMQVAWGAPVLHDMPVPGDYDGDGIADIAVYRNDTGEWLIRQSTDGNLLQVAWGAPVLHDTPVPGDYDGDGQVDIAVYRQDTGEWFIRQSTDGNLMLIAWGSPFLHDTPVPGDFDGDGQVDIAVYRQDTGEWLIRQSTDGNLLQVAWGAPVLHDVPVSGDFDGDGQVDIAVYRQDTGEWFIRQSTDGTLMTLSWGSPFLADLALRK